MRVTTVTTYDYRRYKTIGLVSVVHIEDSAFMWEYFKNLTNLVSSSRSLVENRFNEARQTCLDKMIAQANEIGASEIIGMDIDTQTFVTNNKRFIVFTGTGTGIRKIQNEHPSMTKTRRSRSQDLSVESSDVELKQNNSMNRRRFTEK